MVEHTLKRFTLILFGRYPMSFKLHHDVLGAGTSSAIRLSCSGTSIFVNRPEKDELRRLL